LGLTAAVLALLIVGLLTMASCGGGGGGASNGGNNGSPGTPAGTYSLDISATYSGNLTTLSHDFKLTLVVH
jgi:hypothetical protein